jgi:lysozyme family protein
MMPRIKPLSERCIDVVLRNEGGFQDNPNDPGNYVNGVLKGTNFGIAAKYFPSEDIKNLTRERAVELYLKYFWEPMNLEGINDDELVLQIFDFGVNAGRRRSIRLIQGIVNAEPVDGICGPITKGRINSFKPITKVQQDGKEIEYTAIDLFREGRKHYYIDLANRNPDLDVFLQGWLNRINRCKFA